MTPDARGLSAEAMQALAAEFNYSETTFVLPPEDPAHTARVRIFTPRAELPFAGHPNVGTGFVLAGQGRDRNGAMVFEERAGLVEVLVKRDAGGAVAATTIAAPRPLALGAAMQAEAAARCAGLAPSEMRTDAHAPVAASMGTPFVIAEVDPAARARAAPDIAAFRAAQSALPELPNPLALHLYARDGGRLRARMFAPLAGIAEGPATGSANVALAGLLLSLSGEEAAAFEVVQGVEMGRPSLLRTAAHRAPDGIRATVGGGCVAVLRGKAML